LQKYSIFGTVLLRNKKIGAKMSEPILVNEYANPRLDLARPSKIENYESTFGAAEVEKSARQLVTFFQLSNQWRSFTFTELLNFYELQKWNPDQMLFGLIGPHYHPDYMCPMWCNREPSVVHDYNRLLVTESFVTRCSRNIKQVAISET
jgi:hypothetical protein